MLFASVDRDVINYTLLGAGRAAAVEAAPMAGGRTARGRADVTTIGSTFERGGKGVSKETASR